METRDWYHQIPQRVQKILGKLRQEGHTAWLVGGAVRDMLLGIKPKDFDIATNATPTRIAEIFPHTIAVGAHFGVMIVVMDGEPTEVATFRKDSYYIDARHPAAVEYSTPEEDSQRRDFTINGLYWNPETKEVVDYVGGMKDLESRVIRTIGRASARFQEDALRPLRALRFYSQLSPLGFTLDKNLVNGIKRQGHLILQVSKERITEEMFFILRTPKPSLAIAGMKDTKLFERIFPQLRGMSKESFDHLLFVVDNIGQGWKQTIHGDSIMDSSLLWAAFLQFFPDAANSIKDINSLLISKHEARSARRIILSVPMIPTIEEFGIARLKEFLAMEEYFSTIALYLTNCRLIRDSSYEYLVRKRREFIDKGTLDPEALISGEDLIEMGIEPGPQFKEILESVRNEQLEEKIHTKEEAIALVHRIFGR